MSAWHRDDLEGAMEHLRTAEKLISPEEMVMKTILWYSYTKVYSKKVGAWPLGSSERQEEKKNLSEAMAQVMRMIEVDPGLEEQVKDDPALLDLGRRLRMVFVDDG
jgi:hypothetical protein